jgi:protocatechuate 3,4-dioxygenase beta subunit
MTIRNFSEDTLTAEVLKRIEGTPNARLKEVMTSLVKHLHAFVREVRPTPEEWFAGIKYLTDTSVSGNVSGLDGKPVAGALLDIWEAGGDGFYDVQKPEGTNLRARFRAGADGSFHFRCVKPSSYPVPHDGPVGRMLAASGRHPMRPGHLHFMIQAPGYEKLVTHLFVRGDEFLDSDAVFGVKDSLIVDFRNNGGGGYEANYDFVLKPAAK